MPSTGSSWSTRSSSAMPPRRPARCRRTPAGSTPPTSRPTTTTSRRPRRCSTKPDSRPARTGCASSSTSCRRPISTRPAVRRLSAPGARGRRDRRHHRGQRQRRPPEGGLYRPRVRPRHRTHGLPRRSGDLDDDPRALRHSGGRALLEPGGLRERGARPGDRRGSRHPRPGEAGGLYDAFQRLVTEDLPLINVADWSFTSVASDKVENIASNPRWAVSNWADTGLSE